MAVKSVIDIEVNSSEFERFYALFNQYTGELEGMPEAWKGLGYAMGEAGGKLEGGAVSGREALALAAAQASVIAEALREATKAQDGLTIASKRSGGAMEALHKSARGVGDAVSFLAGGIMKMVAFAGIGGILGGLGIGELAASGFNRYKQAGQLGVSPGELASFQTNAQQFLDVSALEAAANAKIDITKSAALGTLGINYAQAQGMKSSDLAFAIGQAAAAEYREDARNGTPQLQDPRIFWAAQQLGLDINAIRNIAAHPEEYGKARRDTRHDAASMNFDQKAGIAWTEFKKELDRAGFQIQTSLIEKLAAFAPVLEKLTGEAADFVTRLVNSKQFGDDVKWAAGELGDLAHFLEGIDWAKVGAEVTEMGAEIGVVADKLKWLLPAPDFWTARPHSTDDTWSLAPDNPFDKKGWANTVEGRAAAAFSAWYAQNKNGSSNVSFGDSVLGKALGGAGSAIASTIAGVAKGFGVDPFLAIADAQQESGLNPRAKGDYENGSPTSFGAFQLHRGGELGALTPEQAYDPTTNAKVALSRFADVQQMSPDKVLSLFSRSARASNPNITHDQIMALHGTPGEIAAVAQRPADEYNYALAVNSKYKALVGGFARSASPAAPSATPPAAVNVDQILRTVDADIAKYGKSWVQHLPKDVAQYVTLAHLSGAETSDPAHHLGSINKTLKAVLRRTPTPINLSVTTVPGTSSNLAKSINAGARS